MNGIVHNFTERLAFSQSQGEQESAWGHMYQDAWPNVTLQVRIDANSKFQEWGVDRHIYLPNGKILAIDEKERDPSQAKDRDGDPYTDILIEEWSVWRGERQPGNKVGWSLDTNKHCDYIAYAIPAVGQCYLLPFELLRMAAQANLPEWKILKDTKGRRCYPLDAQNRGYVTRNCAVSWPNVHAALVKEMKRVRTIGLPLPTPTIRGQQAEFDWVEP